MFTEDFTLREPLNPSRFDSSDDEQNDDDFYLTETQKQKYVVLLSWGAAVVVLISTITDAAFSIVYDLFVEGANDTIFQNSIYKALWLTCFLIFFTVTLSLASTRQHLYPFKSSGFSLLITSSVAGVVLVIWVYLVEMLGVVNNFICSVTLWVVLCGYMISPLTYLIRAIRLRLVFNASNRVITAQEAQRIAVQQVITEFIEPMDVSQTGFLERNRVSVSYHPDSSASRSYGNSNQNINRKSGGPSSNVLDPNHAREREAKAAANANARGIRVMVSDISSSLKHRTSAYQSVSDSASPVYVPSSTLLNQEAGFFSLDGKVSRYGGGHHNDNDFSFGVSQPNYARLHDPIELTPTGSFNSNSSSVPVHSYYRKALLAGDDFPQTNSTTGDGVPDNLPITADRSRRNARRNNTSAAGTQESLNLTMPPVELFSSALPSEYNANPSPHQFDMDTYLEEYKKETGNSAITRDSATSSSRIRSEAEKLNISTSSNANQTQFNRTLTHTHELEDENIENEFDHRISVRISPSALSSADKKEQKSLPASKTIKSTSKQNFATNKQKNIDSTIDHDLQSLRDDISSSDGDVEADDDDDDDANDADADADDSDSDKNGISNLRMTSTTRLEPASGHLPSDNLDFFLSRESSGIPSFEMPLIGQENRTTNHVANEATISTRFVSSRQIPSNEDDSDLSDTSLSRNGSFVIDSGLATNLTPNHQSQSRQHIGISSNTMMNHRRISSPSDGFGSPSSHNLPGGRNNFNIDMYTKRSSSLSLGQTSEFAGDLSDLHVGTFDHHGIGIVGSSMTNPLGSIGLGMNGGTGMSLGRLGYSHGQTRKSSSSAMNPLATSTAGGINIGLGNTATILPSSAQLPSSVPGSFHPSSLIASSFQRKRHGSIVPNSGTTASAENPRTVSTRTTAAHMSHGAPSQSHERRNSLYHLPGPSNSTSSAFYDDSVGTENELRENRDSFIVKQGKSHSLHSVIPGQYTNSQSLINTLDGPLTIYADLTPKAMLSSKDPTIKTKRSLSSSGTLERASSRSTPTHNLITNGRPNEVRTFESGKVASVPVDVIVDSDLDTDSEISSAVTVNTHSSVNSKYSDVHAVKNVKRRSDPSSTRVKKPSHPSSSSPHRSDRSREQSNRNRYQDPQTSSFALPQAHSLAFSRSLSALQTSKGVYSIPPNTPTYDDGKILRWLGFALIPVLLAGVVFQFFGCHASPIFNTCNGRDEHWRINVEISFHAVNILIYLVTLFFSRGVWDAFSMVEETSAVIFIETFVICVHIVYGVRRWTRPTLIYEDSFRSLVAFRVMGLFVTSVFVPLRSTYSPFETPILDADGILGDLLSQDSSIQASTPSIQHQSSHPLGARGEYVPPKITAQNAQNAQNTQNTQNTQNMQSTHLSNSPNAYSSSGTVDDIAIVTTSFALSDPNGGAEVHFSLQNMLSDPKAYEVVDKFLASISAHKLLYFFVEVELFQTSVDGDETLYRIIDEVLMLRSQRSEQYLQARQIRKKERAMDFGLSEEEEAQRDAEELAMQAQEEQHDELFRGAEEKVLISASTYAGLGNSRLTSAIQIFSMFLALPQERTDAHDLMIKFQLQDAKLRNRGDVFGNLSPAAIEKSRMKMRASEGDFGSLNTTTGMETGLAKGIRAQRNLQKDSPLLHKIKKHVFTMLANTQQSMMGLARDNLKRASKQNRNKKPTKALLNNNGFSRNSADISIDMSRVDMINTSADSSDSDDENGSQNEIIFPTSVYQLLPFYVLDDMAEFLASYKQYYTNVEKLYATYRSHYITQLEEATGSTLHRSSSRSGGTKAAAILGAVTSELEEEIHPPHIEWLSYQIKVLGQPPVIPSTFFEECQQVVLQALEDYYWYLLTLYPPCIEFKLEIARLRRIHAALLSSDMIVPSQSTSRASSVASSLSNSAASTPRSLSRVHSGAFSPSVSTQTVPKTNSTGGSKVRNMSRPHAKRANIPTSSSEQSVGYGQLTGTENF